MDSGRVAVVTDSTAYLPDGIAEKYDIRVVPLTVIMEQSEHLEGVELSPKQFAEWITGPGRIASTRPPSSEAFRAAFLASGARKIVSIHISARLSGTREAAVSAAYELYENAGPQVKVVDSRTVAMGLGFAVIEAAEVAAADGDVFDVASAAEASARRTTAIFYVETLEYLRRGGRIGKAAALLGTALAIKPLLTVHDGMIEPLERVRTTDKAIARLEDTIVQTAGPGAVDIAVHHLAAEDGADELGQRLRLRLPGLQTYLQSEVGAVIGAHVGPGLLGAIVHRRAT